MIERKWRGTREWLMRRRCDGLFICINAWPSTSQSMKVINELRAAGAEALSVNGQRLTGTSEIRCAGPTLSVNNVRSAPPFEVRAIGDTHALEQALKMRGGVADTLKVWGIELVIETADDIYIPAYKGALTYTYAHETEEEVAP